MIPKCIHGIQLNKKCKKCGGNKDGTTITNKNR